MTSFIRKFPPVNPRKLAASILVIAEVSLTAHGIWAQSPTNSNLAPYNANFAAAREQSRQPQIFSAAYVDFLTAEILASDGSRPEALRRLAQSLRLQPQDNPASALAFELLMEQRTNSRLLLRGHKGGILYAAYSPDGTKIVTASDDHTARVWDAQTGKQLTPPLQHGESVLTANFSPDGKRVVTGSADETARIWDVATGQPVGAPMQATGSVLAAKFSPDGKIIATGTDNGRARTWDSSTGKPISPQVVYHEAVYSVNFSPDGSRILTGTGDSVADLLDPKTGVRLVKPLKQNNIIFTAVFSPDGNTILTASADHTAKTWDAKTGQPLGPIFRHSFSIDSAAFDENASRVVTTSWGPYGQSVGCSNRSTDFSTSPARRSGDDGRVQSRRQSARDRLPRSRCTRLGPEERRTAPSADPVAIRSEHDRLQPERHFAVGGHRRPHRSDYGPAAS